jgi:hypothetical protein
MLYLLFTSSRRAILPMWMYLWIRGRVDTSHCWVIPTWLMLARIKTVNCFIGNSYRNSIAKMRTIVLCTDLRSGRIQVSMGMYPFPTMRISALSGSAWHPRRRCTSLYLSLFFFFFFFPNSVVNSLIYHSGPSSNRAFLHNRAVHAAISSPLPLLKHRSSGEISWV